MHAKRAISNFAQIFVKIAHFEISNLSSNFSKRRVIQCGLQKRGVNGWQFLKNRGHWVYSLAKKVGLLTATWRMSIYGSAPPPRVEYTNDKLLYLLLHHTLVSISPVLPSSASTFPLIASWWTSRGWCALSVGGVEVYAELLLDSTRCRSNMCRVWWLCICSAKSWWSSSIRFLSQVRWSCHKKKKKNDYTYDVYYM